jgi:hypothetical protein
MDLSLLIPLLVIALGAAFMYFVGAVIIQALRLSIIQVKSDVQIKMDKHQHELKKENLYLESKRLKLVGETEELEKKEASKRDVMTLELKIDGETSGLKEALESIPNVKKFAILNENLLIDIDGDISTKQLIEKIEKGKKLTVTQVNFAKNPEMTRVKD